MPRTKLAAAAVASLVSTALTLPLTASEVGAAPSTAPSAAQHTGDRRSHSDNLTPKWQNKYAERKQAALEQRLRHGGHGSAERLGRGKYARVAQTGQDRVFVILAEFGNRRHSAYCDSTDAADCDFPSAGDATTYKGPLHNQIPKPPKNDNVTNWRADYSRDYYRDLVFRRMRNFYEQQSSGKYSIDGAVQEWVKVPFNEARYGRSNYCDSVVCSNSFFLIRDAMAYWVKSKRDAGWSMDRIRTYLETFDVQDRNDFDEDGVFNEPDGYIDHLQIVHAGGDQADGDPVYGDDAIWSHRSFAQIEAPGTGPTGGAQDGGVNIGEGGVSDPDGSAINIPDHPTGVWAGDYTMQAENGGLSVFAHEYGHDLGLPDLYDTSGNTGGASNSTDFWTLMSQSRGTAPGDEGIGDRPMPFGAWEKFQLGWLVYKTFRAGRTDKVVLRPGQSLSDRAHNGAIVLLPDKQVNLELGAPCDGCGDYYFYSDQGDELDNTMTHEVAGGGALTAKVNFDIESGFDYAFLEASSDGGNTWRSVRTSQSYTGTDEGGVDPNGNGISGASNGWVDLTATIPAGSDAIRWRYLTDAAVAGTGFRVDNITLDGTVLGTAETEDEGWVFDGFRRTTGSEVIPYLNAYIVDNRQYVGRDRLLKHLYNFGFLDRSLNKVEFFKYDPGALISYWDTSYTDNNVGEHPGHGQVLPVDAHPFFDHYPGTDELIRTRILTRDSTFSLERAPAAKLHYLSQPYKADGYRAVHKFNDLKDYWFNNDEHGNGDHPGFYEPEWYGVDVPKTGTTVTVKKVAKNGDMTLKIGTAE